MPSDGCSDSPKIPRIDIGPLFGGPSNERTVIDRQIYDAAFNIGFMTITGLPQRLAIGAEVRQDLLRFFSLSDTQMRPLWKRNFAEENPNLYRGVFPAISSPTASRVGYEIGPDLVRDMPVDGDEDLLCEATPFPVEDDLPGWREAAAGYFLAMEEIGGRILDSLSRTMGIDEGIFRSAFDGGISTLRLLHYPKRVDESTRPTDENYYAVHDGVTYEQVARAHVDSGLLTVLAQCGVSGLQAQDSEGDWIDVPPDSDGFAINFGGLLARWTGGRIKATRHRVLGLGEERFSIPFFFEPRPDAVISPLPIDGVKPFQPFQFGDHLWATTTKFPENYGLAHLRPARAPYQDPLAD
ncbi:2OG-Fe(II) oxygenase family protein [Rhodovibrionaceae bacterium A322]